MRFKQSWWRQNRTVIKKKSPVSPPVQIQQVKTTAGTVAQVVQHTNNTQASSTQNSAGMVRLAVLGAALFLK